MVDVKSSAVATLALRQQWLLKVILETSRSPPLVPSQSDAKVVGVNSNRFCSCPLEVTLRSPYPLEVILRPIYCTTRTAITERGSKVCSSVSQGETRVLQSAKIWVYRLFAGNSTAALDYYLSSVERVAIARYGHPRCTIPHLAYLLVCRPFRPRLLYLQLFRFRVAVAVVIAVEDCNMEKADVELLTMMCLEHVVMSAARSVETLFEAHNLTKHCVQRQQGCLQCCRASCRLGVESTAEVVHKSAVATRYASEQNGNIER